MKVLPQLYFVLCFLLLSIQYFHVDSSLLSTSSFNSSAPNQLCPRDQSLALVQFNNSFSTDYCSVAFVCPQNRKRTIFWKEGTDCCLWEGVKCESETGNVIGLDLSCSCLRGTISANSTLFHLHHLQKLNLAGNDFLVSPLSSKFGEFTNLTHLIISGAAFTGTIPLEISHLSNLVSLDLSGNFDFIFEGHVFEKVLGNLTQLRHLFLDGVNMSSVVPTSFLNMSSYITTLTLEQNELQGKFPVDVFRFPCLQKFMSSYNYHLEINFPKSNWSAPLLSLEVRESFLREVPDSIGNLRFLKVLDLFNSQLEGSIPASLVNLTRLNHLDLSINLIHGPISFSFSNFKQLSYLDLSKNNLVGPIIDSFGNLTQLFHLSLGNNQFSGPLPFSVFNLPVIESLNFARNKFVGPLPNHVSRLPRHPALPFWCAAPIQYNFLSGEIRSCWFPSSSLGVLDLKNNKLVGEIPSSICDLVSMQILDLSNNNLSGVIPECLNSGGMKLFVLDLSSNKFNGNIPNIFPEGNQLQTIQLNNNDFHGPLPKSLVNCHDLEVLNLGNNKINDTFPHWLGTLPQLLVLVLRANYFRGPVIHSENESHFSSLRILDLSHNKFSGFLPTSYFKSFKSMMNLSDVEMGYMGDGLYYQDSIVVTMKGVDIQLERILKIFTTIDMSSNKFEGKIPELVGKLTSLHVLNFSNNKLTGQIPSSFGNLAALESLDLSSNKLVGTIPMQLASLNFLEVLNLSQNQLVGQIPQGKQFNTFLNDSYEGNLGLCGFPLSKRCGPDEPPAPLGFHEESDSAFGLDWKFVLMGYGCGLVFGFSAGYIMLTLQKPTWLVKRVQRLGNKVLRRLRRYR